MVAAAGWGAVKLVFTLFGVVVIAIAIWGFHRAHTAEFKEQCAAYQVGMTSMSFPDNLLCLTYWQLK